LLGHLLENHGNYYHYQANVKFVEEEDSETFILTLEIYNIHRAEEEDSMVDKVA